MSKKIMISLPMGGRKDEDVLKAMDHYRHILEKKGFEVIDTFFVDKVESKNRGLNCLGRSIVAMAECDVVFFAPGWREARGCVIEHYCAETYGLEIITIDDLL